MKTKIKPVIAWAVYLKNKLWDDRIFHAKEDAAFYILRSLGLKKSGFDIIKVRITPVEEERDEKI